MLWPMTDLFDDVMNTFRTMQREIEETFRRANRTLTSGRGLPAERQLTAGSAEHEDLPLWVGYPPIDAWVEKDRLHLRAELPGVNPDDIEVLVQDDQLILRGRRVFQHEEERQEEGRTWIVREMGEGRFERRFRLPEGVEPDKIEARYHDGILELSLPVSEKVLPRRVPIQLTEGEEKKIHAA